MPRNTLVWLPLQSRKELVHRRRLLSLTVVVLQFTAVTPTCHCKETGVLESSPQAVFSRLTDSCMELSNRPCRRQRDHVGSDNGREAGSMWLALFPHL